MTAIAHNDGHDIEHEDRNINKAIEYRRRAANILMVARQISLLCERDALLDEAKYWFDQALQLESRADSGH